MERTPFGLFGCLPHELIFTLLQLLPISDVLSLRRATYESMPVFHKRISPSEYLQINGPFTDASSLLKEMSMHGAVLSGSRALEWFVPGSISEISDWDFYVPPIPTAIQGVKNALERSGVKFESCLSYAARKLKHQPAIILSRNDIFSIAYEASLSPYLESLEQDTLVRVLIKAFPVLKHVSSYVRPDGSARWIDDISPVSISKDGSVAHVEPQEMIDAYPYARFVEKVLHGTAKRQGKVIPVQLIVSTVDLRKRSLTEPIFQTIFRSIFSFYASHVQCILTKEFALHLYYKSTMDKIAYRWQVPVVIQDKAESAVEKYIQRGFQFKQASENEWVYRSVIDQDSCFLEFGRGCNDLPLARQAKEIEWCYRGEEMHLLSQSAMREARQELLLFGILHRYYS